MENLDALDYAVLEALKSGNGSLEAMRDSLVNLEDRELFVHTFLGILAACTKKEVWDIALDRTKENYRQWLAMRL